MLIYGWSKLGINKNSDVKTLASLFTKSLPIVLPINLAFKMQALSVCEIDPWFLLMLLYF